MIYIKVLLMHIYKSLLNLIYSVKAKRPIKFNGFLKIKLNTNFLFPPHI